MAGTERRPTDLAELRMLWLYANAQSADDDN